MAPKVSFEPEPRLTPGGTHGATQEDTWATTVLQLEEMGFTTNRIEKARLHLAQSSAAASAPHSIDALLAVLVDTEADGLDDTALPAQEPKQCLPWEILLDRGWVAFDQRTATLFTEAEAAGNSTFEYQARAQSYMVDLIRKRQVNQTTGKVRVIRRHMPSSVVVLDGSPKETTARSPDPFWLGAAIDVKRKGADPLTIFQEGDHLEVWSTSVKQWCPGYVAAVHDTDIQVKFRGPGGDTYSKWIENGHEDLRRSRDELRQEEDVAEGSRQKPSEEDSPEPFWRRSPKDAAGGSAAASASAAPSEAPVQAPELGSEMGVVASPSVPKWECCICFTEQTSCGWLCPQSHRFCSDCMRHHVDAKPFPRCPHVGCEYELDQSDLEQLMVSNTRLEAFQQAKLLGAVDTLADVGEMLVRCSDAACPNVVVLPADAGRRRFACHCGAVAFCTHCRQAPYHFHAECSQVQSLREQWLAWNSGGREDYHGRVRVVDEQDEANTALREAIARHEELEKDERWKARHCRLCPKCSRPIHRVAGCASMICGQNYHGGAQQPGCGHSFSWTRAQRYMVNVERRELPGMNVEQAKLRGRSAFHPFTQCQLCHEVGIAGPRFRCIHCENFDACSKCEERLTIEHERGHVFEVMFESDFQWSGLPRGTKVRLVRSGDILPSPQPKDGDVPPSLPWEGLVGVVRKDMSPSFDGYRIKLELVLRAVELASKHVEPVLTSRLEAEELLSRSLETEERRLLSPKSGSSVSNDSDGSDNDDSDNDGMELNEEESVLDEDSGDEEVDADEDEEEEEEEA